MDMPLFAMTHAITKNTNPKAFQTEGIKYAGSKLKLLGHILEVVSGLNVKTVLDGFSGSTRVAQLFARANYDTTSSDIACWSEVFGRCYLMANQSNPYYTEIIDHLNDDLFRGIAQNDPH